MNLSRLMVLGLLADRGPMHGHRIRREAEVRNVEFWGGVSVGALYRELHRMQEEELVEPVRSEQVGRRPARTVYRITDEGRRELAVQRQRAITELRHPPDALGVALLFGGRADRVELGELMRYRRQALANMLEALAAERARLEAQGSLSPVALALFRRCEERFASELAWQREMEESLARLGPAVWECPNANERLEESASPAAPVVPTVPVAPGSPVTPVTPITAARTSRRLGGSR